MREPTDPPGEGPWHADHGCVPPQRWSAPWPQLGIEVRQTCRLELLANVYVHTQAWLVAAIEPPQRPRQEPPRQGGQLPRQPQITHRQIREKLRRRQPVVAQHFERGLELLVIPLGPNHRVFFEECEHDSRAKANPRVTRAESHPGVDRPALTAARHHARPRATREAASRARGTPATGQTPP